MNPLDKNVYEAIARKDLSFGCKVSAQHYVWRFSEKTLKELNEVHGKCVLQEEIEDHAKRIMVKKEDLVMQNITRYPATILMEGGAMVSAKGHGDHRLWERDWIYHYFYYLGWVKFEDYVCEYAYIEEIIGHPILLSDVLEFIYKKANPMAADFAFYPYHSDTEVLKLWDFKIPTYEEQSEECKTFIRNLVK